ncbi:uncharacterized protein LOC121790748 [Salvia splendens]|uniref:uncharacterized protein LOC121790748 n=1 Tax=Salvia splendens TaxID=180675 RepID=UPI001C27DA07|nr:uncharacterized protein LOC121790748 [Salvia splendens]
MFHELYRSKPAPNVALKLDMAKAYDRVQWPFLSKVLKQMGFPEPWINMVERCIGYCWFSVWLMVRSRDSLSLLEGCDRETPSHRPCSLIAADYLSRALDNLILGRKEMTFKSTRASTEVSHLAYVDDIIIFTQAAVGPIGQLKAYLDDYTAVSGQLINLTKSNFFITENNEGHAAIVETEEGFSRGTFPLLILESPFIKVRSERTCSFSSEKKSQNGSRDGPTATSHSVGGLLSSRVHLKLFRSMYFKPSSRPKGPSSFSSNKLHASYGDRLKGKERKTHWIGWEQVCLPTAEGGLGIRCFEDVLKAFNIKLWWRFREHNSLWATHLYSKYCTKKVPFDWRSLGQKQPNMEEIGFGMAIGPGPYPVDHW